ncbi:hypothetical protein [Bradyrhizobium liaoningense]|uniref:hypothetical protein n=1 Tax=Bradyrhizobium liaoningense TaxID=43992 RepID=UPI001BA89AB1|nr:hypothetical protein [Bradyrhizobium liaoningense]MBR1170381.1 hypothetical protein [Bradyrhizobium liaoningense]
MSSEAGTNLNASHRGGPGVGTSGRMIGAAAHSSYLIFAITVDEIRFALQMLHVHFD